MAHCQHGKNYKITVVGYPKQHTSEAHSKQNQERQGIEETTTSLYVLIQEFNQYGNLQSSIPNFVSTLE